MQFVCLFTLYVLKFLLQAIEDRLVGCLSFAVGVTMSNGGEPSLATQVVEIIDELIGVELSTVVEDGGTGDAEASDGVSPNKPSYFSSGYGGYSLGLYPLGEVVDCHKEVLAMLRSLGERAEDVHSLSSER